MPKVNVKPKESDTGSPHWSPKRSPRKHGVHKESRLPNLGVPNVKKVHAGGYWRKVDSLHL